MLCACCSCSYRASEQRLKETVHVFLGQGQTVVSPSTGRGSPALSRPTSSLSCSQSVTGMQHRACTEILSAGTGLYFQQREQRERDRRNIHLFELPETQNLSISQCLSLGSKCCKLCWAVDVMSNK